MSARDSEFVTIESHWLQNILSAAALLEGTGNILDKREADALRKLAKSAKPAAPAPVAGDDARDLIESFVQHADANPHDGYPRKLVDAARSWVAGFRDSVAGDAVAKLPEKWRIRAQRMRDNNPRTETSNVSAFENENNADELEAALAQDRASQAGAAVPAFFPNGSRAEWQDNLGRWWPVTITNWHSATYSARLDDGTDALKYPTSRFRATAKPTPAAEGEVRNV